MRRTVHVPRLAENIAITEKTLTYTIGKVTVTKELDEYYKITDNILTLHDGRIMNCLGLQKIKKEI